MNSQVRIAVLREEFAKLGYTSESLVFSGTEYTKFTAPDGVTWLYKDRNGRMPFPYVGASALLNDKKLSALYAREKGVRVPRTIQASNMIRTVEDYRRVLGVSEYSSIVVKPADETLSRGVSANVRTDQQLEAAMKKAREHSQNIIVQERIEGDEFRFLYIGTSLRTVIHKAKLRVVGNGHSTVRELILDENRQRLDLTNLRVRYPQLSLETYQKQGVDLARTPHDGEVVQLDDTPLIERGASFYEVMDGVHDSYKDIANTLAKDFGGGYLAVDIIIPHHTEPATNDNYAFLEFNDIPAPMYFYACRNHPELPMMKELVAYIDKVLHLSAGRSE
ncbi:MAG: hypothetical protein ACTJG2_02835 [Candidatus Saccharimonadales bacterium]